MSESRSCFSVGEAWTSAWRDVDLKLEQRHAQLLLANEVHGRKQALAGVTKTAHSAIRLLDRDARKSGGKYNAVRRGRQRLLKVR